MSQEKQQPPRLIFRAPNKAASPPESRLSEEERLRLAREKAEEYRNLKAPIDQEPDKEADRVQAIEQWADLVTTRIDEAMRRGDFENLSGRGKPLRVEPEPFVPEDQQMANRILKNNDMTPNWIAERKEMLAAVERWRSDFQRIVGEAMSAWVAASSDQRRQQIRESWARWLARWDDELLDLNRRIGTFNLKQPITHLEIYKLRLDDELRKVGMARALDK